MLYNQGAIMGAIHLYIGQEAVAVGVCRSLRDEDTVFSTHRGHGHAIAKSGEVERIMAELMGRDTGLSRGHGGSMHLFEPPKGLMGGNGIVGGGIPLSLGGAFTAQYQGSDQISVGFFSDGAVNQGTFAECLNLAALWKLPVLLVCENNQYAATTPVERSTAVRDVVGRARAYGVQAEKVDGNDVQAVYRRRRGRRSGAAAGRGPAPSGVRDLPGGAALRHHPRRAHAGGAGAVEPPGPGEPVRRALSGGGGDHPRGPRRPWSRWCASASTGRWSSACAAPGRIPRRSRTGRWVLQ